MISFFFCIVSVDTGSLTGCSAPSSVSFRINTPGATQDLDQWAQDLGSDKVVCLFRAYESHNIDSNALDNRVKKKKKNTKETNPCFCVWVAETPG